MKIKLFVSVLFFMMIATAAHAQYVKVRIGFPVGIHTGAIGRMPYAGAVWIAPEWQWRGGHYIIVPGFWARPGRHGAIWVPGHWKYSRKGYRWVPGHWR